MSTPPAEQPTGPIYSDVRPIAWVDVVTLGLGGVMALSGLAGGNSASLFFGFIAISYVFLFTHSSYRLYEDTLVIRYRLLRRRVVPIEYIDVVEPLTVALVGPSVFIALLSGTRMFIKPRDPVEFVAQVKKALGRT